VLNAAGDVVRVDDAASVLGVSRADAAKILARWTKQGLLRRVGRGAYVSVPIELIESSQVIEDPWVLVPALFGPAYVGGWTAAEHWDLTEQIFREIFVFTARPLRDRRRVSGIFGKKAVWRLHTKVLVSDIDRTMLDLLDDPSVGGGIQHVADCFERYLQQKESRTGRLIEYADRLGNGAVFKRLGFLCERLGTVPDLEEESRARLTKGHAMLDPKLRGDRLITRWKLRVPASWGRGGSR